jgi:hypothetical protein
LLSKESGLFKPSKAQAQQISTISKERLRDDALGRPTECRPHAHGGNRDAPSPDL